MQLGRPGPARRALRCRRRLIVLRRLGWLTSVREGNVANSIFELLILSVASAFVQPFFFLSVVFCSEGRLKSAIT